jgi:predicted PurR-regulated permease PerM
MAAAAGVAVTYGVVELVIRARSVLVIIGLALFIAAGLDPVVSWLTRWRLPRWGAVVTVRVAAVGILAGFLLAAIPPLAAQASALADHLPQYLHDINNPHSSLGRFNLHYHIEQKVQKLLADRGTTIAGGVLGAGEVVLSAASSMVVVAVLSTYFLAGLPTIKLFLYRLAPRSRRPRVILIGDEISTKVGGYLHGNFLTSIIAGAGTYVWMLIFGIPYPALLGLLVALLDLIPVVGSTIGGIIVTLVALTISVPVAIATLSFYVGYRLAEDYLLVTPDHGQDGRGARDGDGGRGADRRRATRADRRAGGDPGRRGDPAAAARGYLPPDGQLVAAGPQPRRVRPCRSRAASPRRSCSDVPPHTPCTCRVASA